MDKSSKGRRVLLLVLVAAFALVSTAAFAAIPNDGVINACYSKIGGALRVIDASVAKCKSSERPLAWNVQGEKGDPGPAGPEGPQGPPGPAGISAARFVKFDLITLPDSDAFVQIGATSIPTAGSDVVTATLLLQDSVRENTVDCELRHGSNFMGTGRTALAEGFAHGLQDPLDFGTLTFTGGAQAAAGDQISVWCGASGQDSSPLAFGQMMILEVGGFF